MMATVSSGQRQRLHPHKFTLWVAIGSILMMFAGLTSAYIVKRGQPGWESVETPHLFIWSTVAILASSVAIQVALRNFKQRNMQVYRSMMLVTLILGVAFVALQWGGFQWMWDNGVRWRGASAGQFLYIIAGLHALHVLGGIVALLIQTIKAFVGRTKSYNSVPLEVTATYWHFVDVLWIYLLIFFVWLG